MRERKRERVREEEPESGMERDIKQEIEKGSQNKRRKEERFRRGKNVEEQA